MTIFVKPGEGSVLEVLTGEIRLMEELMAYGVATVHFVGTEEQMEAHEVAGKVYVYSRAGTAAAAQIASQAIARAMRR